jgi:3-methylcrotonyl-CoA carboxylase alpha subunit
MFQKILIANRGEIACRVAATARRMGIRTVAVYSEADARARHVLACDEALCIGPPPARESYLVVERILTAARASGAEAIHPGYGFLSENEDFAQACADAGIVFVGPPPAAIKAMGLKAESKQLMERAGVPLVPGYHGADQDPALLAREAERIGYPVLIKASAGGGGKGMRAVQRTEDFAAALASCKREAKNSFGDDAVLIERYVTRPRHVEIQVFFDRHGNGVYLFERDCSVQRRHQKVLEEAPAPGMSAEQRRAMGEAAVAAARAVGYVGAGTVEFIVEPGEQPGSVGRFYFMEMNTRLQVEHPVTEMITGLDLVEWQLRVAAGERLPRLQQDLRFDGHAIEARICAENPERDFLPATGRLDVFTPPPQAVAFTHEARDRARLDAGVGRGDAITPYYDSMVAKLIVWGADRAQALARLDAALAELHIVGLQTNVQFLRRVLASRSFAAADLDTALIERERAVLFGRQELDDLWVCAALAAQRLAAEQAAADADPWSQPDGFRLNGTLRRTLRFKRDGRALAPVLSYGRAGSCMLALEAGAAARSLGFRVEGTTADGAGLRLQLALDGQGLAFTVYRAGEVAAVFGAVGSAWVVDDDPIGHARDEADEGGRLTAPMPGKVVALLAKPGDAVRKGQPLAVMEAMKMEHTIAAPDDGVVEALPFAVGEQVAEGAELVRFAQASAGA